MEQEQTQSAARGTVLLLPPDPDCSIPNQMRAGEKLGAAALVVIAGATDENLAAAASSATTIFFTDNVPSSEPPPAVRVEGSVDTSSGPREDRPNSERARRSGKATAGRRGAREETGGDVLGPVADRANGASAVPEEPAGDACPPPIVVVGHEEGKRVLEWLRGVHSNAVKGGSTGGDVGGGNGVTASLATREDVGRLWGDVLWASDPRNWPAGGGIYRPSL